MQNRVVITGFGLVSPIGCTPETVWEHLSSGQSGIRTLQGLDCSSLPFRSGGEVQEFTGAIDDYGPLPKQRQRAIKKNRKVMCREIEMGVAAAQKALNHAHLDEASDPDRCGCLFGCDYILTRPEEYADGLLKCRQMAEDGQFHSGDWPVHGLQQVNPLWLLKYLPNMPNSHVSIYNDFRGPNNAITDRDASMNLALGEATSIIQRGAADVMLVGATGTKLHPLRTLQMALLESLASERDDPASMSRPFDSDCDGMVLGEGAAAIVLESYEHAKARSAKPWGEVLGYGAACSGSSSDGDPIQIATQISMQRTLNSAGSRLPTNWHVHAQGLGAPAADEAEAKALSHILHDHPTTPVTAAKSYFGNLGAGAAAIELICSLLALEKQNLFPIKNLNSPIESVQWQPATADSPAGDAVLHTSCNSQGQAASLLVGRS